MVRLGREHQVQPAGRAAQLGVKTAVGRAPDLGDHAENRSFWSLGLGREDQNCHLQLPLLQSRPLDQILNELRGRPVRLGVAAVTAGKRRAAGQVRAGERDAPSLGRHVVAKFEEDLRGGLERGLDHHKFSAAAQPAEGLVPDAGQTIRGGQLVQGVLFGDQVER